MSRLPEAPSWHDSGRGTLVFRNTVDTFGGKTAYTLEVPRGTEDRLHKVVGVGLEPGFAEDGFALRAARHAIVIQRGRPAFSVSSARSSDMEHALVDPGLQRTVGLKRVLGDIAARTGLQEVDLVGHSFAGQNMAGLDDKAAHKVRAMAWVASSGLIEGDSEWAMMMRLPGAALSELPKSLRHPIRTARMGLHMLGYVGSNPLRAMAEQHLAATDDIRPDVARHSAQHPTVAVQFESDYLFPHQLVEASAADLFDNYSVHPDGRLGHNAPYQDPGSILYVVDQLDRAAA